MKVQNIMENKSKKYWCKYNLTESANSIACVTWIQGTNLLAAWTRSSKELRALDSVVVLEEGRAVKHRRLTAVAMASNPMSGTNLSASSIGFIEVSLHSLSTPTLISLSTTNSQRLSFCSSSCEEDFSILPEVGRIKLASVKWLQDPRVRSASTGRWGMVDVWK